MRRWVYIIGFVTGFIAMLATGAFIGFTVESKKADAKAAAAPQYVPLGQSVTSDSKLRVVVMNAATRQVFSCAIPEDNRPVCTAGDTLP